MEDLSIENFSAIQLQVIRYVAYAPANFVQQWRSQLVEASSPKNRRRISLPIPTEVNPS